MLNDVVRLVRKFHGTSQSELAAKLGISKSFLSEIESGKKKVSLEVLRKYSETYSIPISSFFIFDEHMSGSHRKIKSKIANKIVNILSWIDAAADSNDDDENHEKLSNRSVPTL